MKPLDRFKLKSFLVLALLFFFFFNIIELITLLVPSVQHTDTVFLYIPK